MLHPEEIQAAIITLMMNQPQLVSAVRQSPNGPTEIREDNWMGVEFSYPAYRVGINSISPKTNGECRLKIVDVAFSVYGYAEGTSSKQSAYLAGLVSENLMGKQVRNDRITPVTRIDIPQSGIVPPVPEGERLWRSEVQFMATLKEV